MSRNAFRFLFARQLRSPWTLSFLTGDGRMSRIPPTGLFGYAGRAGAQRQSESPGDRRAA